jgi:tol-pal system protein YbgF
MTRRPWGWLAALPAALLIAWPAQAGLFDDDEARRAILDLRAKYDALDAQQKKTAELAAQNAALSEQIAQLRRSLLELNTTLELMRGEMAKMRGQDEQIARDVAELQRKAKDIATGVDDRIRRLEPQKVSLDGAEFLADPDEKRQFDESFGAFRAGEFDKAISGFSLLNRRWPGSGYKEASLFWLGNSYYGKRDYKDAIGTFRALVAASPMHPKAPEALLAIANCQVELKDNKSARRTLDELVKGYPSSEAAQAGKERLSSLRG